MQFKSNQTNAIKFSTGEDAKDVDVRIVKKATTSALTSDMMNIGLCICPQEPLVHKFFKKSGRNLYYHWSVKRHSDFFRIGRTYIQQDYFKSSGCQY